MTFTTYLMTGKFLPGGSATVRWNGQEVANAGRILRGGTALAELTSYTFQQVDMSLFISSPAQPVDATLTWQLSELLRMAERHYGPRDESFTLVGVQISEQGFDRASLQRFNPLCPKHIVVNISRRALDDRRYGFYELAHETIHCLAPGKDNAPNVEEGLAVLFSEMMVESVCGVPRYCREELVGHGQPYGDAVRDVECLQSGNPTIICALRKVEPTFHKWTADLIRTHAPWVDEETAARLVAPFDRVMTGLVLGDDGRERQKTAMEMGVKPVPLWSRQIV
jgi:hypothetical protein